MNIIEIESSLGGFCDSAIEIDLDEDEIVVRTITPFIKALHGEKVYSRTYDTGDMEFNALHSLLDQQHIEDVINDKREQE